jgi:copper chaperone CopZ
MTSITLNVPDISCERCERAITTALAPRNGIADVSVDIRAKQVRLTYDASVTDIDRVEAILAEEDYPVASRS